MDEKKNEIDVIKYYRLRYGMSRLELCKKAEVCDTTYRYYEAKKFEIQDYRIAERLVNVLGINDKVDMPDEFKIKKKYPMNKILEIINKYGKREFSKRTGIGETTINTWFCKGAPNQLANCMYKKMVKLFIEDNIEF